MSENNYIRQPPDPIDVALPPSRSSNSLATSAEKEANHLLKPLVYPYDHDPESPTRVQYYLMNNYNVNTLVPNRESPGSSSIPASRGFESIGNLLEKQLEMLRLMNERQLSAAEAQTQPVPPLPARSSSSWGALLRSVKDNIEPHVERWRSGLDALLVFIGLFSAIVTAFFVDSSHELDEDPVDRTNEILSNFTEIFLSSNQLNFSSMGLPYANEFVPEARDLRLNAYWSISLVMSISIAALAVTCRRLLSSLTKSQKVNAYKRVTEIFSRWSSAEATLSYVVEALPQLMVLPVILFLAGILDFLYTSTRNQPATSTALNAAFAVSTASFSLAILGLLYLVVDRASVNHLSALPLMSRSFLEYFKERDEENGSSSNPVLPLFGQGLHLYSPTSLGSVFRKISNLFSRHTANETHRSTQDNAVRMLTDDEHTSFHKAIQLTHDDDQLDQAAACLDSLIIDKDNPSRGPDLSYHCSKQLDAAQLKTINYLLTSEASLRSNRTASNVVSTWYNHHEPPPYCNRGLLVENLISVARLYAYRYSDSSINSNPFLKPVEVLSRARHPIIPLDDVIVWSILYNCSAKSGVEDLCAAYLWPKILEYGPGETFSNDSAANLLSRLVVSLGRHDMFTFDHGEHFISQCFLSLIHLETKDISTAAPELIDPFSRLIYTMQEEHRLLTLKAIIRAVKDLYSQATFNRLSGSRYEVIFSFSRALVRKMVRARDNVGICFLAMTEMLRLLVRVYGEGGSEAPFRVPTRLDCDFLSTLTSCISTLLRAHNRALPSPDSRYHELEMLYDAFERYLDSLDGRRYASSDYLHSCLVDSCKTPFGLGEWQVMQSITAVLRINANVRLPPWACTELFERYFYPLPSAWERCIINNSQKLPEYKHFQSWENRVFMDHDTEPEPKYLCFVDHNTKTTTLDFPADLCPVSLARWQHQPESPDA